MRLEEALRRLREDPVLFARRLCGFEPYPYQERLLRDRSKRIVVCWGRQTGKSTTAALKAVHFAYTNPETTTLIVSPSRRQSELMFGKVRAFIHSEVSAHGVRVRLLEDSVVRETRGSVELTNGSLIAPIPAVEDTVRGYTAHLVVVDEAPFVRSRVIERVIMPMLSSTDGTLILLGTPWSKGHVFYRAYTNLDGVWSVHHTPSTECPHIPERFLEEQRNSIPEEDFRREYLAEFVEPASRYFTHELIASCVDNGIPQDLTGSGDLYGGLDLGKLRDHTALALVDADGGVLRLRLLRVYPVGTPYSRVVSELKSIDELYGLRAVAVDRTGVGEPVYEEVRAHLSCRVYGVKFTQEVKASLMSGLKALMEAGRLRIPCDRTLMSHLSSVELRDGPHGGMRFTHPRGTHDDAAVALALACWAASRHRGAAVLL